MPQSRRGLPFIGSALAFLAIGIATNRVFLAVALAFFIIGLVFMRRQQ